MSSEEQSSVFSAFNGEHGPERRWAYENSAYDEFPEDDDQPIGSPATGLVSLGYIRSAVWRGARLWCSLAAIGCLFGVGLFVKLPETYQATTSLILTNDPNAPAGTAIVDDQAMVQSRAVAGSALKILGLHESVENFVGQYTATVVSQRVLLITVKATTAADAIRDANALASAFLTFQAHLLRAQEQLIDSSLDEQVVQAQQHVHFLGKQLSQQPAGTGTSGQGELGDLQIQYKQAARALKALQQTVNTTEASSHAIIAAQIKGSQQLDTAALTKSSVKKRLLLFVGGGLLAGLAIGLAIVIIAALATDRLRRRDDVARALGAPVSLSVEKIRLPRWRPGRGGLAAARHPSVRRLVAHLQSGVTVGSGGAASLAVVAVDDVRVPALCVASLALGCAEKGQRVVVADLCDGAHVARLLGVRDAGVSQVTVGGIHLVVAVPDRDDVAPGGPLRRRAGQVKVSKALAAAVAGADLLLSLAVLDPASGGDHLAGWAEAVVAVVTTGKSSAARINGVGEMIRMGGVSRVSGVLVGADKTDESLGLTRMHEDNVATDVRRGMPAQ